MGARAGSPIGLHGPGLIMITIIVIWTAVAPQPVAPLRLPLLSPPPSPPTARHPVVAELAAMLAADAPLRQSTAFTIERLPAANWTAGFPQTIDGLLEFFYAWAVAVVTPDTAGSELRRVPTDWGLPVPVTAGALTFVGPMWALASSTGNSAWMRDRRLLDWLQRFVVEGRGAFMDSAASWPPEVAAAWRAAVNFSAYNEPAGGWTSFNAFFTRDLRSKTERPVQPGADVLVAPCDGFVWVLDPHVVPSSDFSVKADSFDVRELVGYHPVLRSGDAYLGGLALCNFLAATDYHRVWAPVSGTVVVAQQLDGLYVANGDPAFVSDHRRALLVIDASAQGLGNVTMVLVGMYDISSIVFAGAVLAPGARVAKGDEVAYFQYGGSEIVTLFDSSAAARLRFDPDIPQQPSAADIPRRQVGQRMAVVAPAV